MIDTLQVFQELQEVLPPEAARRVAEAIGRVYEELQQGVTRAEFQELHRALTQLAEAQQRTERQLQALAAQVGSLAQRVEELTEAQRRTEQQVQALTEAQRQTDQRLQALAAQVGSLAQRVEELAEAQRRTEQQVQALTEAQRQTDQRLQALATQMETLTRRVDGLAQQVEKLVEAQRKTEAEVLSLSRSVKELTGELRETRQQLGGLAMTVGYTLENEAFKALPGLLARDFGLTVHGPLRRKYVIDRQGDLLEVNIVGQASQNGESVTIVGEAKVQLSKNDVDRFVRKKLKRLEGTLPGRLFPVLVTHMTTAVDVEAYARSKGIAVYYSYEF